VGKQSENTDFQQGTARRIIPISPAESWDLHETITDFLTRFTKNVKDHTEKIEKDFDK
jgi:hypothetical protein